MKISSCKYPIDIILCLLLSIFLIPVVLLELENTLRVVIGLPFILFIPGFTLIFTLFPNKDTIDVIERIALSLGLSLAIVPLIGLGLNYTMFGIRIEPMLFSTFIFIIVVGTIGIFRWYKLPVEKRFIISINLSFPKSEKKLDKVLTLVLVIIIIFSIALLVYVIITPKIGERFTEFYLLGPEGNASGYPSNLPIGENGSIIIGVVNHEFKTVNYTIEIWLVNQTTSMETNQTTYHNMWFMDKINISLNHTSIDIEQAWKPQWEHIYNFDINRSGTFKLAFLLYKESDENYNPYEDYKDLAPQKIDTNNTTAYRTLHLWINV